MKLPPAKQPLTKKGLPEIDKGGPKQAPNTGTPGYAKAAASAAESRRDFDTSSHRQRNHQAGTGMIRGKKES